MNESTLSTAGDWAREVVPAEPASHTTGVAGGDRRVATALAAALVAAPLAMTAWFLVEPSVLPREDAEVFLTSVASSPQRYLVGTGFVLISGLAGLIAAFALASGCHGSAWSWGC